MRVNKRDNKYWFGSIKYIIETYIHVGTLIGSKLIFYYLNWQEARLHVKPTTCSANSASSTHCLECTLKKMVVNFDKTYEKKNILYSQSFTWHNQTYVETPHTQSLLFSNLLYRRALPTSAAGRILVMCLFPVNKTRH